EFRSLSPKLGSLDAVGTRSPAPAAQPVPVVAGPPMSPALLVEPTIVDDPTALAAVVAECRRAPLVALDTETSSLDPMRAEIVGMSLAVAPGRSWYLPFAPVAPDGVLDPGRRSHAIDDLSRERLSLELQTYADVAGRGRAERPFESVPVADAARYCCGDSEMVLRLREAFQTELEDHQLLALLETVEVPLISVLVEMEWRGVLVDLERLADISRQFARELAELERAIYATA